MLDHLTCLYGAEQAAATLARLQTVLEKYAQPQAETGERWTERSNILITYGDMVGTSQEPPLATLASFLSDHVGDVVDMVHILPFFPWSSDDGFSVIDYRAVDPALGTWSDVARLGERFGLMFDLVLNHCSSQSQWFSDFVARRHPGAGFFVEIDPGWDLSRVVRPRKSPLATEVRCADRARLVWTTFSADQVDLDFSNPDVLVELSDILLSYVAAGARIIRLDAIAYLWKEVGTECIHHPKTHEVVKLFRAMLDRLGQPVVLLTETNVPHAENVSYFGAGDEAHMVYNFSLPPLLLHALSTGSATTLTRWAAALDPPPAGCTFLNFTASHDGIGVRPLEGIVAAAEVLDLATRVEACGGKVSMRSNPDGSLSPYEINATFLGALRRPGEAPERGFARFLCSQSIALGLAGVPAIYFHSLVGTENDVQGMQEKGYPRAINRRKWQRGELESALADPRSSHARTLAALRHLLKVRSAQPAFHPDAPQKVLELGESVFAFERISVDGSQRILCASNVGERSATIALPRRYEDPRDILGDAAADARTIELAPYQTAWLSPR